MISAISAARDAASRQYHQQKAFLEKSHRPGQPVPKIEFKKILLREWERVPESERQGLTFQDFSGMFGRRRRSTVLKKPEAVNPKPRFPESLFAHCEVGQSVSCYG